MVNAGDIGFTDEGIPYLVTDVNSQDGSTTCAEIMVGRTWATDPQDNEEAETQAETQPTVQPQPSTQPQESATGTDAAVQPQQPSTQPQESATGTDAAVTPQAQTQNYAGEQPSTNTSQADTGGNG